MVSAGISIYNREYIYIYLYTYTYYFFSACQSLTISHFGDHLGPDFVHPCGGSPVLKRIRVLFSVLFRCGC